MDTIVNGATMSLDTITYTAKKVNDRGGSSIGVLNKVNKSPSAFRIQTPNMLTWGAADYEDKVTGERDGKYSMALQFPDGEYSNAECDAFLDNIIAFENKIKADALRLCKDWFGKEIKSVEVIDALYSPMLKYPKIKGTAETDFSKKPTLRIKLPSWEGKFKFELYDENSSLLYPSSTSLVDPLDYLGRTNVMCLIQCGGLWFANGKFGVTWRLVQCIVQKPKASILGQGTCFMNIDQAARDALAAPVPNSNATDDTRSETRETHLVEDSDAEDEHDDAPVTDIIQTRSKTKILETEPTPAPQPQTETAPEPVKKVKRVVRKKNTD